jgi:hypothetical protein
MRSFLRRLLPGATRGRSLRIRKLSRLLFERLDARKLMAADAAEPVAEILTEGPPPAAEVLALEVANTPTQAPADSPLWGEKNPGELGNMMTLSSGDGYGAYGGYGGYGSIAPQIVNFIGTESTPGMWTFTGQVNDDEGVYGLIIDFGGILQGEQTMVRQDGTFELTILLDPNASGTATATVTDYDGLTSEEVEWVVG